MKYRCHLFLGLCFAALTPIGLAAQEDKKNAVSDDAKNIEDVKHPFKRLDQSTDEDLRKQLHLVPEAGFDQAAAAYLLNYLKTSSANPSFASPSDLGPKFLAHLAKKNKRPELNALPWKAGVSNQMGKEMAQSLHVFSLNLRACMRDAVPAGDVRPDKDKLKKHLTEGRIIRGGLFEKSLPWNKAECLPSLAQILPVESVDLRLLMVDMVSGINSKEASVTLAQRVVFDTSAKVREKAIESLSRRPVSEYRQTILDGFRWPWRPAAEHAAEALVALQVKDAVPKLVELLKEPDPKLPYRKESPKEARGTYVREIVRINHMSNCLLCHAPSLSKEDFVRGLVPMPGQDPPQIYYADEVGSFVRADIVFLRQEFSLVQPVGKPGKWPGFQRYDYMIRERKASTKEVKLLQGIQKEKKLLDAYPQRDAILYALRELTGEDRGIRTESWLPFLNGIEKKNDSGKK